MSRVSIIVAATENDAIGRGGAMLYHLPGDLRRFKRLTMGHPIIMGRRTFESLPKGALPGRRNIVVTSSADFNAPGTEVARSLVEAVEMASDADVAYIIGGGQVYREAFAFADEIELTRIHATAADADTFIPAIDPAVWREAELTDEPEAQAPDTEPHYTFHRYLRRR